MATKEQKLFILIFFKFYHYFVFLFSQGGAIVGILTPKLKERKKKGGTKRLLSMNLLMV